METRSKFGQGLEIIAKICTILIPVVLFYWGNRYQEANAAETKIQQNYDRVANLLKSLSSKDTLERKLALKFSETLSKTGDFPPDLFLVIAEVSLADTDPSVASVANNILQNAALNAAKDQDKEVEKSAKAAIKASTRVYLQATPDFDKKSTIKLRNTLESKGFSLPGIETVSQKISPENTEVRYFNEKDKPIADIISKVMKQQGLEANVKKINPEKPINRSQVEVWLKK
ncbi:hypothetical protein [Flavobacterium pallidum]|nr:hypothetical protein [Flavobacterium pallidum]